MSNISQTATSLPLTNISLAYGNEMTNFIQEVQRLKEEDQLEELVVPVPISEEQALEEMKETADNTEKTTDAEKADGEKV